MNKLNVKKKHGFAIGQILVITLILLPGCSGKSGANCNISVYKTTHDCNYVFYYDGMLRTCFLDMESCKDIQQYTKRFGYQYDSVLNLDLDRNPIQTDSLFFGIYSMERTTCMQFALSVKGDSCISVVETPMDFSGSYAFCLSSDEKKLLDILLERVVRLSPGVYVGNSHGCPIVIQLKTFGPYGEKEYIFSSDTPQFCDTFGLCSDFILTMNNQHCHKENMISRENNNGYYDIFIETLKKNGLFINSPTTEEL